MLYVKKRRRRGSIRASAVTVRNKVSFVFQNALNTYNGMNFVKIGDPVVIRKERGFPTERGAVCG